MFQTTVATATNNSSASATSDLRLPVVGRIFKLHEAAEVLRISRSELYRIMDSGRLKTIGAHKARRVLESDLVRYVQSLQTGEVAR